MRDSLTVESLTEQVIPAVARVKPNQRTQLELSQNQISAIQQEAFQGLDSLTHLYLDSNKISSVAEGAFKGLELHNKVYNKFFRMI